MIVKIKQLQETVHSTVLLGCFYLFYCCILICIVCFVASFKFSFGNCSSLAVCIVVVDLCVLLSYVYLLYYVYIFFYFKCRTVG